MIEVPIYLFTGFLDSGKTTVIKDTLEDPTFNSDNPTTLIICLEQGEEEYDEDYLKANNADIEYLDSSVYLTNKKIIATSKYKKANNDKEIIIKSSKYDLVF